MAFNIKNYATSFYIGETTKGIGSAVFFDPSFAGMNNKSPVTLITGSPGSGKTFLGLQLCAQSAIAGKMVVVIDPKADFISVKNLEKEIGEVRLIQLSEKSKRGIIDPFVICGDNKQEGISLAKDLIETFTGMRDLPSSAIDPILADVAAEERPSLTRVMEKMLSFNRDNSPGLSERVRDLGTVLKTLSEMPFAKLVFSNPYRVPDRIPMRSGLTIITMLGLDLPNTEKSPQDYSYSNRLSSGLMSLTANYVHKVMQEDVKKSIPKLLIIDEAWSVAQNQQGAGIIQHVSLLGRSLNMSLVLCTQNARHVEHVQIENAITTFFAFKTNGKREADSVTELMGLRDKDDPDTRDFTQLMGGLDNGECLMKDLRERYATVKISDYKESWKREFETNPIEKARREAERMEEKKNAAPKNNKSVRSSRKRPKR